MASRLLYFGTDEDVRPGDRVAYTTLLLRRRRLGTVVLIPPKTALELDEAKRPPEDWLIRFDDGTYTGWMYHPEELQPSRRLRLVSRGAAYEPITGDELERQEADAERETGWQDDLIGCGIVIAVAIVLIAVIAVTGGG